MKVILSKRLLSTILALALIVSLFPGVIAAAVEDELPVIEEGVSEEAIAEETAPLLQQEEEEPEEKEDDEEESLPPDDSGPLMKTQLFSALTYELPLADAPYFVFAAETATRLIVPPQIIYYGAGDTLRDALTNAGVVLGGTDYVESVNGVASGKFTINNEDGDFDLDAPASEAMVLRISEDLGLTDFMIGLLITMARYMVSSEGAKNYPAARNAYETLLNSYLGITEAGGASYVQSLNDALDAFEDSESGTRYTVSVTAANENAPGTRMVSVKNLKYLTEYTSPDGVFELVAGSYGFSYVSGSNRVEGTFTVTNADKQIVVSLPLTDWLESFDFYSIRPIDAGSYIYPKDENSTLREQTRFVPDAAGTVGAGVNRGTAYFKIKRSNAPEVPAATALEANYVPFYQNTGVLYTPPNSVNWESSYTSFSSFYTADLNPQSVSIEVSYTGVDGYKQIQTYTANIVKVPTLAALTVTGGGFPLTSDKPLGVGLTEYMFNVPSSVTTVNLSAQAFGSASAGYGIEVNGQSYSEGFALALPSGQQSVSHQVTAVSAGGQRTVYTLTFNRVETVAVTFSFDGATSVKVVDIDGNTVPQSSANRYDLIKGNTYTFTATKGVHYHARQTFEAINVRTFSINIDTTDWGSGLSFRSTATTGSGIGYTLTPSFSSALHEYSLLVPDYTSNVYAWVIGAASAAYRAEYSTIATDEMSGAKNTVALTNNPPSRGNQLGSLLLQGGRKTEFVVVAYKRPDGDGGIEYYQEYRVNVERELSVESLAFSLKGRALAITPVPGGAAVFNRAVSDYTMSVADNVGAVTMTKSNLAETLEFGTEGGNYAINLRVNGGQAIDITNDSAVEVELRKSSAADVITVEVSRSDFVAQTRVYTVTVSKTPAISASFMFNPADALLTLLETDTNSRIWPDENGRYDIVAGFTYRYTLTKSGYVGTSGTFTAVLGVSPDFVLSIAPAPQSTVNTGLAAQWPTFRGNFNNNGVTNAPTPTNANEAVLYWGTKIGEGYSTNAAGSPILVDGYIYTYAGTHIYKVDRLTGKVMAEGDMDHSSNYAITPPTYAEGMVFVALADGCIQAFDAVTLKSLWIYRDAIKGQPNSTIAYRNGYIYTGFWANETADANLVCISITDERPDQTNEEKLATWSHTQKGGFYWAGATVRDSYLLVGTDDGHNGYTSPTANLLSLNPLTGTVIDTLTGIVGDIRSDIVYDTATGSYYFTSKGGYFYGVKVDNNGKFIASSFWSMQLQNGSGSPAMSTSTPVVYNGRAYVGVSGSSQFGEYSGHNITVINLPTQAIAYRVQTRGYPQTSGLLTTAYNESTGYVYVYFIDNFRPGTMRVLKDKAGQIAPLVENTVLESGTVCAQVLFTSFGEHEEYAISSPIADEYGTLYYKNDTGYMFAVGSTPVKLEMTQPPAKTEYNEGDKFDPAGIEVIATYANGMTRDVTDYISYSGEPLDSELDAKFRIDYKLHYQDRNGVPGVSFTGPYIELDLTITGGDVLPGDVDGDGIVTIWDFQLLVGIIIGSVGADYTPEQLLAADVDKDGSITAADMYACLNIVLG